MKELGNAVLLRIFVGENDKYHSRPLYEQIVSYAKKIKLSGATVIKGILGFGADSRMHSAKLLDLSIDLPIIIEIIDNEENINKILPFLDETIIEGLVTFEKVKVIKYRHK